MCIDSDLFGGVIVLKSDVDIWLRAVVGFTDNTSPNRVKEYVKTYNVARKVANAKLSGDFYKIIDNYKASQQQQKDNLYYETKYVTSEKNKKCPDYYHICDKPTCAVYISRQKAEYNRKMYLKRKKARAVGKAK